MRASQAMSKKEAKAYVANVYSEINENKKRVNGELSLYKMAAKNVFGAAKYFANAKKAYDKKPGRKNTERYEESKIDLLECAATYNSIGECINNLVGDIRDKYNDIANFAQDGKSYKYIAECDKYIDDVNARVNKIQLLTEVFLWNKFSAMPCLSWQESFHWKPCEQMNNSGNGLYFHNYFAIIVKITNDVEVFP